MPGRNSGFLPPASVEGFVEPGELASVAFSGAYGDLLGKPSYASVAISGNYADLAGKPAIPLAQIQSDWTQANAAALDFIKNKPTLFSGVYADLSGKPTLFSGAYSDLTGKPALFSGAYADLTGKPTIPAAQVNSDWSAVSGVAQILNKPTLSTVATSGSYNDLANKPTIPAASTVAVTAPITNSGTSTSANIGIAPATASAAGSMSASDKAKLDGISQGVQLIRTGSTTINAILLAGGSADYTVPFTGGLTFPNTNYVAMPTKSSPSLSLGNLNLAIKTKNVGSVVVTATNTGLATLATGTVIDVVAFQ